MSLCVIPIFARALGDAIPAKIQALFFSLFLLVPI